MMQSAAPGAELITVNLTPPGVKVPAGGQPVEMIATIRNGGATVDQYSLEIDNLDPTWYTVVAQSVSLFPGDTASVPIQLHPPRSSATRAGEYTFIVRARSGADPTLVGVTKGIVQVGSYSIFQAEMAPKRSTGQRGKHNLTLVNGGNDELQLVLAGRDAEARLVFDFGRDDPTVPPGSKQTVPVKVRPRGWRLVGEARRYPFVISIRPADGQDKDAREVAGEFVHQPPLRSLGRPLFAALLLFLAGWLVSPLGPDLKVLPAPFGPFFGQIEIWRNQGERVAPPVPTPAPSPTAVAVLDVPTEAVPTVEPTPPPVPTPTIEQTPTAGPTAPPTPTPYYIPGSGFEMVHAAFPDIIGDPLESEWLDRGGNPHQLTENGQLTNIGRTNLFFFSGNDSTGNGLLYAFELQLGRIVQLSPPPR